MIRFSLEDRRSGAASLTAAVCLILPLAFIAVGCGGGSGTARSGNASPIVNGQGRATFAVRWPERDGRLVPVLASSIVIVVRGADGQIVGNGILNRPDGSGATLANSTTLDPLPTGDLMVTATAHPERDGAGVAQAAATAPLAIRADSNTEIRMALQTTIDRLEAAAASPSVGVAYAVQLAATALDADGNIVLTSPGKRRFEISDPKVGWIDPATGILTGNKVGTAEVTVTDEESGKSAVVMVKVTRSAPYRLTWISPLPGLPYVVPEGVNGNGEVVGVCRSTSTTLGTRTGFYWKPNANGSGGEITAIPAPPGFLHLIPTAINDRGQVVGVGVTISELPRFRAFLWEKGKTTFLPAAEPDANYRATDINASGEIIGYSDNVTEDLFGTIPCIWRNGIPSRVIPPGGAIVHSETTRINDSGVFVGIGGFFLDPTKPPYIDFWSPTFNRTTVSLPSGTDILYLEDMNNSGQVAGAYHNGYSNLQRSFVLTNGRFTEISPLANANQTSATILALSDDSTAVGVSRGISPPPYTPQTNITAIRWRYGKTEDLNILLPANTPTPFRLQEAGAASGPGHIAGSGFRGETPQGFLLTPQGGTGGASVGVN